MTWMQFFLLRTYVLPIKSQHSVVTVNISGLIQNYIQELAHSNLPPDKTKQAIDDFTHRLDGAITALSEQAHVVVLPSQAVLKGAPDKTAVVVSLMAYGKATSS
ncbi:MAG: TrbI F-type domain-containing protein [Gammaproteobacteria bacterium]